MERGRIKRPMNLSIRISVKEWEDLRELAAKIDRTISYTAGLAIRRLLYGQQRLAREVRPEDPR